MKAEVNCKGYVLHRLGVDKSERFRSIQTVADLLQIFNSVSSLEESQAIAVIEGSKWDLENQHRHYVYHLLYIESNGLLSQREGIGEEITFTTYADIYSQYLDETGSCYLLMLQLIS